MSQGARISWDVSRSWRATDQKLSDSVSSPAGSRGPALPRSSVTGIGYQHLLLSPHIEVTSAYLPRAGPPGRAAILTRIENLLGFTRYEPRHQEHGPDSRLENRDRRREGPGTRGVTAPHRPAVHPLPLAAGDRYRHHRRLLDRRAGFPVPAPRGHRHRPAAQERAAAGLAGDRNGRRSRCDLSLRSDPDLDQYQGRPA